MTSTKKQTENLKFEQKYIYMDSIVLYIPSFDFKNIIIVNHYLSQWFPVPTLVHPFYSCNMGTSDLLDMYAQSTRAYISGKSRVPMPIRV